MGPISKLKYGKLREILVLYEPCGQECNSEIHNEKIHNVEQPVRTDLHTIVCNRAIQEDVQKQTERTVNIQCMCGCSSLDLAVATKPSTSSAIGSVVSRG